MSITLVSKKIGRWTRPAPQTPTKGRTEQYLANAPYGARHKHCFCTFKSFFELRLVVSEEAVLDARASFWLYRFVAILNHDY
ncbi:hypothetical protein HG66A1_42220 [Gimesia chilikensis]|uniref:Uncharacterized protein n=1 Tax=Gimesia chilikensis TaxID=2605989 RepID=A0A517PSR4_9PLAN|nr:hypothetical protein HG66A1_42220 [Gimesia chilikensis]